MLVNNAGMGCVAPMIEVDMVQMRETFNVNVFGLVMMVQAVTPTMISQRSGVGTSILLEKGREIDPSSVEVSG